MHVAVLSDFHIGSSERGDAFRHREREFLQFLDLVEADHDRIIFLGDIYQCEQGASLTRGAMECEFEMARRRTRWLTARIEQGPYTYVHGNHDVVACELVGAKPELLLDDGDSRVFLTHGDRFDPLFQRMRPMARTSTWLSGRIRQTRWRGLSDALEDVDIAVKHRRFGGDDGPYVVGAAALATQHRADIVVLGHTHVLARVDVGDAIVANSGSCSHGQMQFVSIDTSRRTVRLRRQRL